MVSISGDIWVYEPNNTTDPDSGLIRITELSDPYLDETQIDKCYQPKWNEDNTKIVFVRRPATDVITPAETDIYRIDNIQNIISGGRNPISSWVDPDLYAVTASTAPDWSPSFSIDGNVIGYCSDQSGTFNNCTFNNTPALALVGTNFDAYDNTMNPLGTPPLANSFNEGFVKWAPSGGDKFIYVKEDNGIYKLKIVRDETISGTTKAVPKFIQDKSKSSVELSDADSGSFNSIKMYSPLFPPRIQPTGVIAIGEFRHILGDETEAELFETAKLKIYYSQAEVRKMKETDLKLFFWNAENREWEKIKNALVEIDGDGVTGNEDLDGGFIIADIMKLGLYGIFGKSEKVKAVPDLAEFRVFPNPYRPNKDNAGTEQGGIIFDKLPDDIKDIKIYNIAGDMIASLGKAITLKNPGTVTINDYYSIDLTSGFAKWNAKNDKGKNVVSGIYIYLIRTESETKSGKIAIIK